ncbi:hypothetical protein QNK12_06345 [Neobacillus cucumis]|nr:hypothetical protein QNK12_06345 [Neobacillus cucumis]
MPPELAAGSLVLHPLFEQTLECLNLNITLIILITNNLNELVDKIYTDYKWK